MRLYIKKLILPVVLIISIMTTGCGDKFDPVEYTQAILDLSFQADITKALELEPDATEESLYSSYYKFIGDFVTNNLTNELGLDEDKESEFQVLVAKIFQTLRYGVEDSEKTGRKEYEVEVKIWPTDTFVRFMDYIKADAKKLEEKRDAGGYTGTDEEIEEQIMNDITTHAYELMDVAYSESTYGKEQVIKLEVKAESGNEYEIDADDMNKLIVKILRLDELN